MRAERSCDIAEGVQCRYLERTPSCCSENVAFRAKVLDVRNLLHVRSAGTERVPATAATGSANVAAGKLSSAPTSVPSLNYRGRSTSQQPLRHAEIHPERSEDHYSAKPNGKSERGDRRSSLGPARSVGALRRKRRTSVDGVAPR